MSDTAPDVTARLPAEIHLASADPVFRTGLPTWLREPLDGCTPGAIREAAVVLGELLTNAFRHALPPYRVRVAALSDGHLIRLAVTDGSPGRADTWRLGRGLLVVRGMCPRWGIEPDRLPSADGVVEGKTVWAMLRVLVPPSSERRSS